MQSALTPHPLRQCNLTLALKDKPMHALCILPAYDISYDVTTVWVGDGYLIQTHQRATTPPQTHTHTRHSTPWVSMPPPHHSSLSFLPWHQPGSLHKLHLYNQLLSGTTRTLPAAQSGSVGHILFVDLQFHYPITNGKYLGKWGLNICAIWSRTPHCEVVDNMQWILWHSRVTTQIWEKMFIGTHM